MDKERNVFQCPLIVTKACPSNARMSCLHGTWLSSQKKHINYALIAGSKWKIAGYQNDPYKKNSHTEFNFANQHTFSEYVVLGNSWGWCIFFHLLELAGWTAVFEVVEAQTAPITIGQDNLRCSVDEDTG